MTLQITKLTQAELDAAITRHFAPPRRHVAHLREPYRDTMPVAPAPAEAVTHLAHDDDTAPRTPRQRQLDGISAGIWRTVLWALAAWAVVICGVILWGRR